MREQIIDKNKYLESAEEQFRRAQENLANTKRKQSADKRKAENHRKYIMGGLCVKYLDDTYLFEEQELDQMILSAGIRSRECQSVVQRIRSSANVNARNEQTIAAGSDSTDEGESDDE